MPRRSSARAITAGGRLPPASVALRACTACSALPASMSLAALSTARWASPGSCFFLGVACATCVPASAWSPAAAFSSAALPAAKAPVEKAKADPKARATGTRTSKRQSRAIMLPVPPCLLRETPPEDRAYVNCKARGKPAFRPVRLFHSHRLGEVARLIHVGAHERSGMVGEQLYGHGIDQRCGKSMGFRHGDVRFELATGARSVCIGDQNDLAAARRHLLHVGHGLVEQVVLGGHHDHGHVFVDEGNWSVLELSRRIALGVNIGNLLQL